MNVSIRAAEEKDLPGVLELFTQPDIDNGEVLKLNDAKIIFNKMKLYPDYKFYVAEMDGKIVGTFALALMDNLAHLGSKSGLIEDVAVLKNFQGQGIGTQMMIFAIEICKRNNCYKVALSSNIKRKNTHKFYDGLGFKIHGYSFLMDLK